MPDTSTDTIRIDGKWYVVDEDIGYNNLASWVNSKTTFGDYTRDSDDVMSSKIWTQFLNGIGVDRVREGSDEGHSWFMDIWAQTPYQMTLNRRAELVSGLKYALGDLLGVFYAADHDSVYPVDNADLSVGTALTGNFTNAPTDIGTTYGGVLYVPQGDDGFMEIDGTNVTEHATPTFISFSRWDETAPKLYGLTTDGELLLTSDGSTWDVVTAIDSSLTPTKLVRYTDRQENEAIYIVHTGGLIAYDPIAEASIPTRLYFPHHPDYGRDADVWRAGEDMFIAVGMGIDRFNLSAISPVGLERNSGVPSEYRGYIVDLLSEYNALYAYIHGQSVYSSADPDFVFDPGLSGEEAWDVAGPTARSLIASYTGFGWHPVWQSPDNTGTPNWMCLSGSDGFYRIWWGWDTDTDDGLYTMVLPRDFSNPRQLLETGEGDFAPTGTLDTGWFDANMQEFDKVGDRLEVRLEYGSPTEYVDVFYMVDYDETNYYLGRVETTGNTILPFGVTTTPDGYPFAEGIAFQRIRFTFNFARREDATNYSPLMDSIVFKYRKLPLETKTFRIALNLEARQYWDRSPLQVKRDLDHLITSRRIVRMQLSDRDEDSYRISLSSVAGTDAAGFDDTGTRRIAIICHPLDGYEGRPF